MSSLFPDDFTYMQSAIQHLRQTMPMQAEFYSDERRMDLTATEDLKYRFRFLPKEIWPDDGVFILSADKTAIQEEIKRSRKDESAWPRIHYLWEMNPVLEWVNDKILAAFGRHEAPVLTLQNSLQPEETVFILSGLIPNQKSHPLVHCWFGVVFNKGHVREIVDFEDILKRTGLGKRVFPNRGDSIDIDALQQLLPDVIEHARSWMSDKRKIFEEYINIKLNDHLKALDLLRAKQHAQLEFRFEETRQLSRKEKERREIDRIFDEYYDWIESTMTTEDNPYIKVIAVLKGTG